MLHPLKRTAAAFGLAALLAAGAFAAPLSRTELRTELVRRYLEVRANPSLLASAPLRYDFAANGAAIDRFLLAMPLSPLEYLRQDMEARRYEVAIPRFLAEAHVRWIELHLADARALYGDLAVDALLVRRQIDSGPPVTGGSATVAGTITVGENRNVATTDVPAPDDYDGEIQIAVNPNNHNQVVAAANTWANGGKACNGDETLSVFYSGDGGTTWSYTCAPSNDMMALGTCPTTVFGSDPAVTWNDNDEVFLNYMLICFAWPPQNAMVVARSTDGGATWSKQGIVRNGWPARTIEDKNFYAIDNLPASPFYGRHYTCWDRDNDEKFAYSSTNGVAWTEVDLPAAAVGTQDLSCEIAVARDGSVNVVYDTLTCGESCTNEQMFHTRSTDGGASWSKPVLVRDFNLVSFSGANFPDAQDQRGINPFGAIDVDNSGGECDGNLYATFSDFSAGSVADNDVWLSRSTDNGASWSAPLRINDGGIAGRAQFHPFLQVDQSNGDVVAAWHDARNDAGNRKVDFYAARSTDCGLSFETNVKVSANSAEFNNSGISTSDENSGNNTYYNPNQYGEYLGLDVEAGKAYIAWTDTRNYFPGSSSNPQAENVGFALVDFSGSAAALCGDNLIESPELCDGSDLGGQTCATKKFAGGTLACSSDCAAFVTTACTGGAALVTRTFNSIAAQDGFVHEKGDSTDVGGYVSAIDSSAGAIRVGDDLLDRQLEGFLSFDTSAIPDGATVLAVTLRLKRGKVQGTNPFAVFGAMSADVADAFGGNLALASGDFQAASTAAAVCTLSNATANGSWSTCVFNASGHAAIDKAGKTQVRLAFARDDNDDLSADWIGYFSGDNATAANRPQLIVTYQ